MSYIPDEGIDIDAEQNFVNAANIAKEALNKSRHASYLHIFRLIARKLLEIHQVFLRHFRAIRRKICLRNLHTRFNQHFLNIAYPRKFVGR